MNTLLNGLKKETNTGYTENGAIKRLSTLDAVYDLFAMGGAMRNRVAADQITLFKKAYKQDATLALKCLFYLRAVRGTGQGERNFFRNCLKWLADYDTNAVVRNMKNIAEFGRFDDYYCLVGTKAETAMWEYLKEVVTEDLNILNKTKGKGAISLLGKWLASENTSSKDTRTRAKKTREAFGMTARDYRQMLTRLRKQIRVVEAAMSANDWDSIDFSTVPSKAGLNYKKAFARHCGERYENFIKDEDTAVKTSALTPVEIAHQIFNSWKEPAEVDRAAWDKYWSCLKDYYNGREERGIAVVDVSGSMYGTPLEAAVSMGAYIAERGEGPFANHFITFSGCPELVEFEGIDLYDKFNRAKNAEWGFNTNIAAVFNLLLSTAIKNECSAEEMPQRIYIFSDQEYDTCSNISVDKTKTLMENIADKWQKYGYELPEIVFWNLNCRQANIPAVGDKFTCVSGFSMSIIETILSGKTGIDMMLEVLHSEQFTIIQ